MIDISGIGLASWAFEVVADAMDLRPPGSVFAKPLFERSTMVVAWIAFFDREID